MAIYVEQVDGREVGLNSVRRLIADHFVGEATVLRAGGYSKAADIILNSLPTNKRTRSGDLAELLASEYVEAKTSFHVPVKKLRWKSDREMPMHGNDVVAFDASNPKEVRVLKAECKSRASFAAQPVMEAIETLDAFNGRPNPSTLAFITKRLYEANRDEEARVFQELQSKSAMRARNIEHLIFALSGTDPRTHLAAAPPPKRRGIRRSAAAIVIDDHQNFITAAFQL